MNRLKFKRGIFGTDAAGFLMALSLMAILLTIPAPSFADWHGPGGAPGRPDKGRDRDFRPDHRPYPPRGAYVDSVPRRHHVYSHRGERFYFYDGIWYRPFGPRFVVVAPPLGIIVPLLPPFYGTIWIGGIPYYYANNVYYRSVPEGYIVVEPPKETPDQANTSTEKVFIYPRKNQSEQQQAKDRYECHRWAVEQTSYDPTQSEGGGHDKSRRADYQRAVNACLDGRGYTVK